MDHCLNYGECKVIRKRSEVGTIIFLQLKGAKVPLSELIRGLMLSEELWTIVVWLLIV